MLLENRLKFTICKNSVLVNPAMPNQENQPKDWIQTMEKETDQMGDGVSPIK